MKRILFVLASLGWLATTSQAVSLNVSTDQSEYLRYELVKVSLRLAKDAEGNTPVAATMEAEPENLAADKDPLPAVKRFTAHVIFGQTRVYTVGGLDHVPLHYVRRGVRQGNWYIPFDPILGEYRVAATALLEDGTTLTASAPFRITGAQPYHLPDGFSVVTDEGGRKGPYATPGFTREEPQGLENLIRWADFMGADAFWQCVGQTQVWGRFASVNFPWFAGSLKMSKKVGKLAHDHGLKYGAWITAFVALGEQLETTGYRFTTGYDRKSGTLKTMRYISLGCEKRLTDIANLLKEFEAAPEIDYLGLDYMRTDWGGYEFADEFTRDMAIPTPAAWPQWNEQERSLWMAKLIEVEKDQAARDRWEWWRAHKVALVVKHLIAEVKPTKPLWIFSLGWQTGHQHGQDVGMMRDAGIGFNAPMFYSIARSDMPLMLKDWREYMQRAKPSLVIGQCVDWNLLGRTTNPSGPEEHLWRQQQSLKAMRPLADSFGLFWHDLARAHYGAKGPYGTMEWVMAGAASFSELKQAAGRIAYHTQLKTPVRLVLGEKAVIQVEISNPRSDSITAVSVEMVPLPRLTGSAPKAIASLGAGQVQTVSLTCQAEALYPANGNRQMVAIKVTCAEDGPRNPDFKFVYLPVMTREQIEAESATPSAQRTP